MSVEVEYEFFFPNGIFEQDEYDKCPIVDEIGDRQSIIEDRVIEIQNILNNMTSLNLHVFSTFVDHDNKKYKVTVNNVNYKPSNYYVN